MTKALIRRQDNYLSDPFIKELERMRAHLIRTYPASVRSSKDKIETIPNLQTDQTIVWLDHLKRVYIEKHHSYVLEDTLYGHKS